MTSTRVVVLAGGPSHERDVSVRSGRRVAEALRDNGFEVDERDMDAALMESLTTDRPACVFPMLHGAAGEDGAIRDILDLLELPYVGSSPNACRMAFDKPVAKQLVAAAGLSTPEFVVLPHETFRELGAPQVLATIEKSLGLPVVVKPTKGGSALGVSIVRTSEDLPTAMVNCFSYGDTAIVERYVEGTEVAVAVIDLGEGPVALPAVEIVPDGGFYDYTTRYTAGMTEFFTPARLDDAVSEAVADAALTAHEALGLRGLSRTDLIVDRDGIVHFLEVNVVPGMTETSLVPQAIEAAGLGLGEVCAALVRDAVA